MAEHSDENYRLVDPPEGMTTEQVRSVQRALEDAANYVDEEISPDRVINTEYYYGEPFGDEQQGRSQVVSQDVRDTVHAILPSVLRTLTSSEKIVEFVPTAEEDVAAAEQATDYANYVFQRDNPGFMILHSVAKDALVRRIGAVKTWWNDAREVTYEEYEELDDTTLEALELDEEVEVTEQADYPDPEARKQIEAELNEAREMRQQMMQQRREMLRQAEDQFGQGVNPQNLPTPPQTPRMPADSELPQLHDVTVKRTRKRGQIRAMAIPPEELIVSKGCRSITQGWRDGHVVAHRTEKTISQLVAMGYSKDELEEYTGTSELKTNEERMVREPSGDFSDDDVDGDDENRRVLYVEAWMALDTDGDDVAELRKICCIGDGYTVAHQEPASFVPLADFCPDPEPHTAVGRCPADVVRDIQRIKSNITRGMLDSLAQSINPRTAVVEGMANMDDVLNNEVGSVVRMTQPGMVQHLDTPFVGQQAFPMLEYMDRMREKRTGITDATQGMNAEVLQSTTKAAVTATVEAAQQQIELICRIFAETGMRDLFRNILRTAVQHQDKPRTVRLRKQEWVPMDPRTWNADMDVEVNTAVSPGNQEMRLTMLQQIAAKQEQILQTLGPNNPLVTLGQYSMTLRKMTELAGFKDTAVYFNELPSDFQMEMPQGGGEGPSPEMLLAEVQREEIQANIEKKRAELELDQQKAAQDFQLRREEMLRRDDRERDRQEKELMLRAAQIQADGGQVDVNAIFGMMTRDRRPEQGDQYSGG